MILDKLEFLEKAIRIAHDELMEEAEALEEGADAKISAKAIKSIIQDLLNSSEKFDVKLLEELDSSIEEHIPVHEEIIFTDTPLRDKGTSISVTPFKFDYGEKVKVTGSIYTPTDRLIDFFGVRDVFKINTGTKYDKMKPAQIIRRKEDPYPGHPPAYLIMQDSKYFAVSECYLEKL